MAIGLFTPAQIDSLAALSPNLVFLDSSPFESRFDSVVLGYELGISLALDHLTELGHTRIGLSDRYINWMTAASGRWRSVASCLRGRQNREGCWIWA